jgi:predicted ABC-type ATPase
VPEDTIRRRYKRSIQNFFRRYRPVVNSWEVYANFDHMAYELIAHSSRGADDNILNAELWEQFQRNA